MCFKFLLTSLLWSCGLVVVQIITTSQPELVTVCYLKPEWYHVICRSLLCGGFHLNLIVCIASKSIHIYAPMLQCYDYAFFLVEELMLIHLLRNILRRSLNCTNDDSVIFTGSGCTGAVHKLVHCLALDKFDKPPVVFVSPFEHHSNLLPWMECANGAEVSTVYVQVYNWPKDKVRVN